MTTYKLPIEGTLRSAWEKVSGSKQTFWAAIAITFAIVFCLGFIGGIVEQFSSGLGHTIKFIISLVNYLLQMGVLYIGICRAKDLPINYKLMFRAMDVKRGFNIIALYVCQTIILIPVILLGLCAGLLFALQSPIASVAGVVLVIATVLAFIVIVARLMLGIALVLDQDLGPINAIKRSFHLTKGNVFPLICLSLLQLIIVALSAVLLLVGLIWTLPLVFINYGMIYQNLVKNQGV